jgi:hypothetical protein
VTGKLDTGDLVDVTRLAKAELPGDLAEFSKSGLVRPKGDGEGTLKLEFGDQKAEIPVKITGQKEANQLDFVHDVAPVLSRLGCNAGTCHGSAQGKNGFKLSLRGYDPLFDVRAFTQELASRRANVASPDDSLMLLKPTGAVPHVGGQLFREGDPSYEILRNWIAAGAKLNTSTPKVAKIELSPSNPIVQRLNTRQQMRVVATYANGEVRDVTRDAYVETGNGEVATANKSGLMTAIRRGEAPILARFEGAYAATTLTVMGDRTGFAWQDPPTYGRIDELVAAKWNRLKIQPSDLCTDAEFIRRVYLDLTGLPPSADEVRAFLADQTETKAKREALVDKLIGSKDYVEYWTNKWADLLQVNRKFLAVEGAVAFRKWIRDQVGSNVPYDKFVHSILTASGSNRENPAASYFKILRDPAATMENTTQLFLAVRFNCNKCHDHPFERWTQDQYYQTAAYFAQVGLKEDPESKGRKIGGTDVESPKPMFEEIRDMPEGEIQHDRTKEVAKPQFPYIVAHETPENAPRRVQLAAWMTSRENPYFARSYVNRLWGYLFGVGIIEPLDDIRAGNPASNPELLEYLTGEFLSSGFNVQHMMRLICKSRTYQLSVADNTFNSDDKTNYSHAVARRLPAEVLFDAVHRVTGAISKIPGLPPGTRAAELPDSEVELPSGFFTTFGRPARESACECERSSGLQLGPVMALVSGPTIGDAIADPENEIKKLTSRETDNGKLVNELFLRILNRPATEAEVAECLKSFAAVDEDHRKLAEELGKREVEVALKRPQEERERQASLAKAQEALAAYEKELAPKLAEAEKQKAQKTAELEAELKKYEGELFAKKLAEWEKTQSTALRWMTLTPKAIESTNGSKAEAHPDGSILVTGENKNGVVTVTAETDLTDITGIRLEVLTDDKLPSKGPGRAPDGNFVLNELEVLAAPKDKPAEAKPVGLHNALSDFNQANLEVTKAADGSKDDPGNGWAVHPAMGVPHWATFEPKEALGASGGTLLTFKFHHKFNNAWTLGRFRLSITKVPKPVGLGLPEEFRTFLATAPELRTEAQKNSLQLYFQKTDTDWQTKANAVALQKAPLPVDPKLKEHKDLVAALSKPLPVDSKLARLRTDLEMSIKQAAANRLTAAQDIAWALVNSPSFLFNH